MLDPFRKKKALEPLANPLSEIGIAVIKSNSENLRHFINDQLWDDVKNGGELATKRLVEQAAVPYGGARDHQEFYIPYIQINNLDVYLKGWEKQGVEQPMFKNATKGLALDVHALSWGDKHTLDNPSFSIQSNYPFAQRRPVPEETEDEDAMTRLDISDKKLKQIQEGQKTG